MKLRKYMVGYVDEPIGIYYGVSEEDAIKECKYDIASIRLHGASIVEWETPTRKRLGGLIAVLQEENT